MQGSGGKDSGSGGRFTCILFSVGALFDDAIVQFPPGAKLRVKERNKREAKCKGENEGENDSKKQTKRER
jgi:hypothetical protein